MTWQARWARGFRILLGEKEGRDAESRSGLLSDDDESGGDDEHRRRSDEDDDGSVTDTRTESSGHGSGESASSTGDAYSDGGDEQPLSPEDTRLNACSDHWNEDYMAVVPKQLWRRELPRLVAAYRAFQQQLTPQVPHYLAPQQDRDLLEQSVVGRALYIDHSQRASLCNSADQTYLVRRDLHYLYAYLITRVLVGTKESDQVRDERRSWMRRQTRGMFFCEHTQPYHDSQGRVCRHCTLLYTRRRSPLYQLVHQQAHLNTQLSPSETPYGRVEPLSYHLVNFMCGPLTLQHQQQNDHDIGGGDSFTVDPQEAVDWVAVHPVYLDVWHAARYGPGLKSGSSNNTNTNSNSNATMMPTYATPPSQRNYQSTNNHAPPSHSTVIDMH